MIYLDNGATTFPKPECVYDAVDAFHRTGAVNAGRGAYQAARQATEMIHEVKRGLISLIDARDQAEVVLTPSVTIALNQIINGFPWEPGMTAYISPYEHNAVLRPLHLLAERRGITVRELPLKEDLSIDIEGTKTAFQETPPDFVVVTAISNVTGYVLPAREIFQAAKEYGAFTLLDGAQAVGLLPMHFSQLRADCIAFAGHKTLYSTFGIAGFYIKNGVNLEEFIVGGNGIRSEDPTMPRYIPEKFESASMDTPAICSLKTSLEWLKTVNLWQQEKELVIYLIQRLQERSDVTLYTAPPGDDIQAGVVSFNIDGFRANEVAALLDHNAEIAVRAGHHCAGRIHKHLNNKKHDGTIRVSFGAFNTKDDVDALMDALTHIDKETLKGIDASILRGNC